DRLREVGYTFRSATDTEVAAHLVAHHLEESVKMGADPGSPQTCISALESAIKQIKGTYGLAVLFRDCPGLLVATRLGSLLVVGIGRGEHYLASDAGPLVGNTEEIVYLNDHETAVITADSFSLRHQDGSAPTVAIRALSQTTQDIDLKGYEHYMLK